MEPYVFLFTHFVMAGCFLLVAYQAVVGFVRQIMTTATRASGWIRDLGFIVRRQIRGLSFAPKTVLLLIAKIMFKF